MMTARAQCGARIIPSRWGLFFVGKRYALVGTRSRDAPYTLVGIRYATEEAVSPAKAPGGAYNE